MRMDLEMKNTSNSDCTHCTIVVSLEMSDEPNLYLLAKYIGETDNVDEEGDIKLTEQDRVEYAKSIRGQLSEGEMLLLRYNCLTSRGEKMRTFVNQFNLTKHLPIMSLLEFRKHRDKLRSDRDANTLDTHFIVLKKRIKEYIGFASNEQTSKWDFSIKYSIKMELSVDRKQFKLTVKRMKNRPATGSDGTPQIEKALNCFTTVHEKYLTFQKVTNCKLLFKFEAKLPILEA